MFKTVIMGATALSFVFVSNVVEAKDKVYAKFPVTVKGYTGSKTNSVAYTG